VSVWRDAGQWIVRVDAQKARRSHLRFTGGKYRGSRIMESGRQLPPDSFWLSVHGALT